MKRISCSTVMYGYNSLSSVTNPIRRRISTEWSASMMGLPNTCALPLSHRNKPIRVLMVVVLPAPFRPKKPKMLPAGTRRSRPRNAGWLSKDLHSWFVSMMKSVMTSFPLLRVVVAP